MLTEEKQREEEERAASLADALHMEVKESLYAMADEEPPRIKRMALLRLARLIRRSVFPARET